jgi:hypothetical protein
MLADLNRRIRRSGAYQLYKLSAIIKYVRF